MLSLCGLAVAVATAVPALRASADLVTVGAAADAVAEATALLLADAMSSRAASRDRGGPDDREVRPRRT